MKKKEITILVSVIVIAVLTVFAVMFCVTSYVVEYDTNGGSRVAAEKVRIFKKLVRPADPVKEGYTFDNWYYNDGIFDFDTRITKDMVIEARWIDGSGIVPSGSYTVSFNSNGGSSVASARTNEDGTVTRPDDPSREGYTFVSWQYNGEDFDFSSKVTKNMTLVAKWEEGSSASVPAEKVTLSPTAISLNVGSTRRISVSLSPKEATNRTMNWTTSNNRVATVDKNGNVRAVGVGTAIITVTVDGKKASVTVTVTQTSTPTNPGGTTPDPIPDTPEIPETPPEEKETYTIEFETIPGVANGEEYVRIKSSKGYYVNGIVQITNTFGVSFNINVTASGESAKINPTIIKDKKIVSPN